MTIGEVQVGDAGGVVPSGLCDSVGGAVGDTVGTCCVPSRGGASSSGF